MKIITLFLMCLFLKPANTYCQVDATGETDLYNALTKSDKKLNKVYKFTLNKISPKEKLKLILDQKEWQKQMDKIRNNKDGGVIENKLRISELIDENEKRIRILKRLISKK